VLVVSNYLLVVGLLAASWFVAPNHYVNNETTLAALLLVAVTHAVLIVERRKRSPLAILLVLFVQAHYGLRVVTLRITDFSREIDLVRGVNPADTTRALAFVACAVALLAIGLLLGTTRSQPPDTAMREGYSNRRHKWVIGLVAGSVVATILFRLFPPTLGNPLLAYYLRIFPVWTTLLLLVTYYAVLGAGLRTIRPWGVRVSLWAAVGVALVVTTIVGSRRAIVEVATYALLAQLALRGRLHIPKRWLIGGIALLVAAVVTYDVATFLRWQRYDNLVVNGDFVSLVELARAYGEAGVMGSEGLLKVADRIGYLDNTVDAMVGSDLYRQIVNVPYYLKSITDDLTPGVAVFDAPLASQIKQFLFRDGYVASFSDVAASKYSSQMFTGFGEFYILFGGWLSLPSFFFVGLVFARIYARVARFSSTYHRVLYKVIVLSLFFSGVSFLESFGLDWMFTNLVKLLIAVESTRWIFKERPGSRSITHEYSVVDPVAIEESGVVSRPA
jgi:hypothetical protein